MSTMTLSQAGRQPFGPVSQARLRSLTNAKNTQNAITASEPSLVKEHAPSNLDTLDAENIDPLQFLSASKGKGFDFSMDKKPAAPLFNLNTVVSSKPRDVAPVIGKKRKAEGPSAASPATTKRRSEPLQAPAMPGGRSPPRKNAGLLSRRRMGPGVTRIDPPGGSSRIPFSLGAALAETIPTRRQKKTSKKSWEFQIYEDNPQDEMANIMEHSTCILDISDDESHRSAGGDRDNKENIPPPNDEAISMSSVHRRDVMTEEVRTPLGDLDAKEFYAKDCDASSAFIVPGDDEGENAAQQHNAPEVADPPSPTPQGDICPPSGQEGWEGLLAELSAKKDIDPVDGEQDTALHQSGEDAAIQIWVSESAKAEDETLQPEPALASSAVI